MTSRLQVVVLAFLFTLQSQTASAAKNADDEQIAPWYEIEVIIFAQRNQHGMTTETWPETVKKKDYPRAYDLALPGGMMETIDPIMSGQQRGMGSTPAGTLQTDFSLYDDGAYTMVENNQLRLKDIYQKLAKSSEYQPLVHIAWRQQTSGRVDALPIFVFEGMTIPDEIRLKSEQVATPIQSLSQRNSNDPFAQQYARSQYATAADALTGPQMQRLYGTIRLSVSRYLHVDADLHLRLPALVQDQLHAEQPTDSTAGDSLFSSTPASSQPTMVERETLRDFPLIESRRMRSKELHYLDNPLFGLIVLVNPYEPPQPPPPIAQPQIELQSLPSAKTKPVKKR